VVLGLLGVSPEKVRSEIIAYLGPEDQSAAAAIEPELGTGVKRVLELAAEEAKGAGQPAVETEHLLLALLRVENGRAAEVLRELGLSLEDLRRRLA
jgi:ATP-dependent Clp protease ATP-binding subunit ClpC